MTLKNLFFAACIALLSIPAFAQTGKLKKADAYYEKLAYAYAADLYVKLIGTEAETPQMKSKLAQCFIYFWVHAKDPIFVHVTVVVISPPIRL